MAEGGLDRPGQNHILKNIVRHGGKFIHNGFTVILSTLVPAIAWADIDISAWVPPGTIAIYATLTIDNAGGAVEGHVSDPSVRHECELPVYLGGGYNVPMANSGIVGVKDQKISYYSTDGTITDMFMICMNGYWIPTGKGNIDI